MSETSNDQEPTGSKGDQDSGEREPLEKPEVGLIADEDLPAELQPHDDNPLAQDPGEQSGDDEKAETAKVEGLPDMGDPA